MNRCSNLYFLSTLACQLAECFDEKELAVLSADLMTLGDMLASLLAHQSARMEKSECMKEPECIEEPECIKTSDKKIRQ